MAYETVKIIKGHRYGYRVESYRIDGKVRQRILEYHGRLDGKKEEERREIKEMLKVGFTEKTKGGGNVMKKQLKRIHKKYPTFPRNELNVLFDEADNETWLEKSKSWEEIISSRVRERRKGK